ncbi:hypothetical protein ACTXT7_003459 [Hymenolepis weldensis]
MTSEEELGIMTILVDSEGENVFEEDNVEEIGLDVLDLKEDIPIECEYQYLFKNFMFN